MRLTSFRLKFNGSLPASWGLLHQPIMRAAKRPNLRFGLWRGPRLRSLGTCLTRRIQGLCHVLSSGYQNRQPPVLAPPIYCTCGAPWRWLAAEPLISQPYDCLSRAVVFVGVDAAIIPLHSTSEWLWVWLFCLFEPNACWPPPPTVPTTTTTSQARSNVIESQKGTKVGDVRA